MREGEGKVIERTSVPCGCLVSARIVGLPLLLRNEFR